MNLKQINEKSPKAFLEWITTLCPMHNDATIVAINETNVEVRSEAMNLTREIVIGDTELMCTPYYFDKFGIEITVNKHSYRDTWYYDIIIGRRTAVLGSVWQHPARLHATKAALPLAFELREKQLKK